MMRRQTASLAIVVLLMGILAFGCAEEDDGFFAGGNPVRRDPSPTVEASPSEDVVQQPSPTPTATTTPKPTLSPSPTPTPRPRESTVYISSPGPEPSPIEDASGDLDVEEPDPEFPPEFP